MPTKPLAEQGHGGGIHVRQRKRLLAGRPTGWQAGWLEGWLMAAWAMQHSATRRGGVGCGGRLAFMHPAWEPWRALPRYSPPTRPRLACR